MTLSEVSYGWPDLQAEYPSLIVLNEEERQEQEYQQLRRKAVSLVVSALHDNGAPSSAPTSHRVDLISTVAMTRSQKFLHLTWGPIKGKNNRYRHASGFWDDILVSESENGIVSAARNRALG